MFIPQAPATETKLLIMGSILSQPLEPVKVAVPVEAASSTNPVPLEASGTPTSPEQRPLFNNCWSCRVLSGSGLIGAGGYVYWVARKPMKLGYPPSPGTVTQMVIGISIACWGIVILADPKGKAYRFG
ncbi:distal membrane-arm assembly complex protein 1 [Rhynchonycteris naso]